MKVTKLAPAMGAEITGIDLATSDFSDSDFSNNVIGEIRAVWLEHNMVVLRNQNLTPQQQLKLARAFGEPDIYPFLEGVDDIPEITAVLKREKGPGFCRSWLCACLRRNCHCRER